MDKTLSKTVSAVAVYSTQIKPISKPDVNCKNQQMCLQYPSEKKTHMQKDQWVLVAVTKQRSPILLNCQEVGKNMDCGEPGGTKTTDVDEKRYDAASNYISVK